MHILQPKHSKLKPEEVKVLIERYNISVSQLPKIRVNDTSVPEDTEVGDVIKIQRKVGDKERLYFRVAA
jgi:DNA-directed RNA polymerase subunit H (RpoH/RPB5)